MVEDAKAARDRRLAEALRANLKRRKAAAKATEPQSTEHETAATLAAKKPAKGDD